MELTFVSNNVATDNATRSKIRRQAAKGKNLGRKINRPSRIKLAAAASGVGGDGSSSSSVGAPHKPVTAPILRAATDHERPSSFSEDELTSEEVMAIEPMIGDSISILNLPIQVAREDRGLMFEAVNFMKAPRFDVDLTKSLDLNPRGHSSIFLQLMFADQAYYHCILAIVASCNRGLIPNARTSSIRHITETFHLVNERINSKRSISRATMAVVMHLSSYESTLGRYGHGQVHLSGLLRMIEVRGGLERLGYEEPEIMQKAFRADLDYALRLGMTPKLDITVFENVTGIHMLDMSPVSEKRDMSALQSDAMRDLGHELSYLWKKSIAFTTMVNEAAAGKRPKPSPVNFLRIHIWLGHRLLNHASLRTCCSLDRVESVVHLGLLTLVSSFMCTLDRRLVENDFLTQNIRDTIFAEPCSISQSAELDLWLLFLVGSSLLQEAHHDAWLLPRLWDIMEHLKLETWEDTKDVLMKYPWIDNFYEKKASSLFGRVEEYGDNHINAFLYQ